MKFLATVTLLATAALAAPNPEPWCWRIGEPCWKVKRATEAFVGAVRSVDGIETRAEHKDIPNEVALSAIQGLDQLATLILYASEDPNAFLQNGTETVTDKRDVEVQEDKRWCYRIGEPCWKAKRTDEIQEDKRWCWLYGNKCWKTKRVAEAVLGATIEGDEKRSIETETSVEKRWCWRIGEPCWKAKRDLETIQDMARSVIEDMY